MIAAGSVGAAIFGLPNVQAMIPSKNHLLPRLQEITGVDSVGYQPFTFPQYTYAKNEKNRGLTITRSCKMPHRTVIVHFLVILS